MLSLSPRPSTAASQNNHMVPLSQAVGAIGNITLLLGLSSHLSARKREELMWVWPEQNYSAVWDTRTIAGLFSSA